VAVPFRWTANATNALRALRSSTQCSRDQRGGRSEGCGAKLRGSGSGRKCEGVTSHGVCKDCQRRAARTKNRANARTSLASADRCGAALKGRSNGKTCTGTVDSDGVCKQLQQREKATATRAEKARLNQQLEAATPSTNRCGAALKGRSSGKTCTGTVDSDGVCKQCQQREKATATRAEKARLNQQLEAATPSTNRCGAALKGRSSGKTCMGTVGADGVCSKCLQRAGMRARLGAAPLAEGGLLRMRIR
jgi:hypothetical protein